MRILDTINNPNDLEQLNIAQMNTLSEEIRSFLIENVSKTGGHLASNLGTVDLTLALHKVFHTPKDKLVFDVGHQCYTHKIITGRKNYFSKLRQKDGLSGFPSPRESTYDAFNAGHGNTSISASIGLARAKKIKGESGSVIAIIGDGAFTGGMVYEGINNIDTLDNLIVILNDNEMSISKNVGALARYLTSLRTSPRYYLAKKNVEGFLDGLSDFGHAVKDVLLHVKTLMRQCIYEKSTFFEELGFQYVGIVDGHNIEEMIELFQNARAQQSRPLFIHIVTKKGKGFKPAEQNPGEFHGVSAFDVNEAIDTFESSETGNPDVSPADSFSNIFGQKLAELAVNNEKLCAITAAMKYGTGLQFFYKQHKKRFFDVGMAEQHAVTFAAGLAQEGLLPVVAIYSTFLQRSYDQIIHDVVLQQLNVVLAIDRAGLVPGDGETHQGIYDAAFLSQIENFVVVSPCNYTETCYWLEKLVKEYKTPRAIRYPRGAEDALLAPLPCTGQEYDAVCLQKNSTYAFVCYGAQTAEVLKATELLKENNIFVDVYKLVVINPLPQNLVEQVQRYEKIIFVEEGVKNGGIGEHFARKLFEAHYKGDYRHIALSNLGIDHATVPELKQDLHLDAQSLASLFEE